MSNPLLDDLVDENSGIIPNIDIALPTRAFFYPDGEVLYPEADPDNISVGSLSVMDESTFSDPLMMMSGAAITRMVSRVAPMVADAGLLCEIDIQAILIASRIVSHGTKMTIEHSCSDCDHTNTLMVNLDEHILRYSPYTEDEISEFNFKLPVVQQTVTLRPMLYKDTIDMLIHLAKASRGIEKFVSNHGDDSEILDEGFISAYKQQFDDTLKTNMDAVAASVYYVETKSGMKVFDRSNIIEWIDKLSRDDVMMITDRITKINDSIRDRSSFKYNCQSCSAENRMHLELDPQKLFFPAAVSATTPTSSVASPSTAKPGPKPSKASRRLS